MVAESAPEGERRLTVGVDMAGRRVDQVLAELVPELSRSRLAQWIDQGRVRLDGAPCRRRDRVRGGESLTLTPAAESATEVRGEDIPLDLVYEDEALLVVNKPAGLVVHPAAGNPDGTLQNALLHHAPELAAVPRAGIVHRLDKDTTGLMVVARSLQAHCSLVEQLQGRTVSREYRALVNGALVAGGTVAEPLGRHPRDRVRMAVVAGGRPAVTHYRVLERFRAHTLLAVHLETGRTHQIRVHMTHIHHPLVGDRTYGGRPRPGKGASLRAAEAIRAFPRQALHAIALALVHPLTGEVMRWEVPMAPDLAELLAVLREEEDGRVLA